MHHLSQSTIRLLTSTQSITGIASIVKEMVENSIDAQGSSLEIKLDNYGLDRIEIRDNGVGISVSDIPYAAKKHYTSKITDHGDMAELQTLGFRGEALGAIAAISNMEIISKCSGEMVGRSYQLDCKGDIVSETNVPTSVGTSVIVSGIYKNIPVRRQYYSSAKRKKAELKLITDLLMSYSIIYYHARFVLKHNKSVIWQKSSMANVETSLSAVLSPSQVSHLRHHTLQLFADTTLDMYLPKPESADLNFLYRTTNDRMFMYLNRRSIHDKEFEKLLRSYLCHNKLPRYPVCCVILSLPAANMDVNIEPDKMKAFIVNKEEIMKKLEEYLIKIYGVIEPKLKAPLLIDSADTTVQSSVVMGDGPAGAGITGNPCTVPLPAPPSGSSESYPGVLSSPFIPSQQRGQIFSDLHADKDSSDNFESDQNVDDSMLTGLLKGQAEQNSKIEDQTIPEMVISDVQHDAFVSSKPPTDKIFEPFSLSSDESLGEFPQLPSKKSADDVLPAELVTDRQQVSSVESERVDSSSQPSEKVQEISSGFKHWNFVPINQVKEGPPYEKPETLEAVSESEGTWKTYNNESICASSTQVKKTQLTEHYHSQPCVTGNNTDKDNRDMIDRSDKSDVDPGAWVRGQLLGDDEPVMIARKMCTNTPTGSVTPSNTMRSIGRVAQNKIPFQPIRRQSSVSAESVENSCDEVISMIREETIPDNYRKFVKPPAKKRRLNQSTTGKNQPAINTAFNSFKRVSTHEISHRNGLNRHLEFSLGKLQTTYNERLNGVCSAPRSGRLEYCGRPLTTTGVIILADDITLLTFNPLTVKEKQVYERLLKEYAVECRPLDTPIPLNASVLCPSAWDSLLSLPVSAGHLVLSKSLQLNGFSLSRLSNDLYHVTASSDVIPGYGALSDLEQILTYIGRHTDEIDVHRPANVCHHIQSEAMRRVRGVDNVDMREICGMLLELYRLF